MDAWHRKWSPVMATWNTCFLMRRWQKTLLTPTCTHWAEFDRLYSLSAISYSALCFPLCLISQQPSHVAQPGTYGHPRTNLYRQIIIPIAIDKPVQYRNLKSLKSRDVSRQDATTTLCHQWTPRLNQTHVITHLFIWICFRSQAVIAADSSLRILCYPS